tara:strand:+ start:5069 stop:5437 length:369 start_codon:yes stop_codon:yes gene_type:complete
MEKKIIEGNKLIAEFIGCKPINGWQVIEHPMFHKQTDVGSYIVDNSRYLLGDCQWHRLYTWLSPVVNVIKKITNKWVPITHNITVDEKKWLFLFNESFKSVRAMWYKVLEFINWYNKQQDES